ncbi:class II aldolase/adducin family protein [Nodosilinea sp. LEGE 06152]|uniref:class II aldolase/adducin family protein n=1 Tax=Nodosilinea sp. LEGE 06152 TaxID=2777966 RepID=UPI00187F7383|nr:class II aldolase/adducin family protein [Nodosilinea sp. LEGE 06152]MBE9160394.1 class II aldolase/adducin family protein [Nodosilinea sp. LEGE 06152]
MVAFDEGVIKYVCNWDSGPPLPEAQLVELIAWRDRMHQAQQIGLYPNGIGYGNISLRRSAQSFAVSGTQTGHLAQTTPHHYTLVDAWDIDRNTLHCTGPIQASSESLTHAALYDYSSAIQAIIHVHNRPLWQRGQGVLPTTAASVPYGTPAMAYEMRRLLDHDDLMQTRILIMAGHEEGVLVFGPTLEAAAQMLYQHIND